MSENYCEYCKGSYKSAEDFLLHKFSITHHEYYDEFESKTKSHNVNHPCPACEIWNMSLREYKSHASETNHFKNVSNYVGTHNSDRSGKYESHSSSSSHHRHHYKNNRRHSSNSNLHWSRSDSRGSDKYNQNDRANRLMESCKNDIHRHRAERYALESRFNRPPAHIPYHQGYPSHYDPPPNLPQLFSFGSSFMQYPPPPLTSPFTPVTSLFGDEQSISNKGTPSQSQSSSKRTVSLSAVQKMREEEQLAGKWLQEKSQGSSTKLGVGGCDVQLVSSLLKRQKGSSSTASTTAAPTEVSTPTSLISNEPQNSSTTEKSSEKRELSVKKEPVVFKSSDCYVGCDDNSESSSTAPLMTVQQQPLVMKKSEDTIDSFVPPSPPPPPPPPPPSSSLPPQSQSIIAPAHQRNEESPKAKKRKVKTEYVEEEQEEEHSFEIPPSSSSSIKPETLSSAGAAAIPSSSSLLNPAADSPETPVEDESEDVRRLMKAIEFSKEEKKIEKKIRLQEKVIDELSQRLDEEKEMLEKLRLKRYEIREAKKNICSHVANKVCSDDDMQCSQSIDSRTADYSTKSKKEKKTNSRRKTSDEQPSSSSSSHHPQVLSMSALLDNHSASSDRDDVDGGICPSSRSQEDFTTVIPAFGNETVRNIVNRVIQSDDLLSPLSKRAQSSTSFSNNHRYNDVERYLNNNYHPSDNGNPRGNDTLSNVSSIENALDTDRQSNISSDRKGGSLHNVASSSVVSDVLSLGRPKVSSSKTNVLPKTVVVSVKQEPVQSQISPHHALTTKPDSSSSSSQCHSSTDEFQAHWNLPILDMAIMDDYLFTASDDKSVKRFNLKTLELLNTYTGHDSVVHALVVTHEPNGIPRLFSGGFDKRLLVFSIANGRELQRLNMESRVHVLMLGWELLFIGLGNGQIILFNIARNTIINKIKANENSKIKKNNPDDDSDVAISSMAHGKEGASRVIMVGGRDGSLVIRKVDTGILLRVIDRQGDTNPVIGLNVLGHRLLYSLSCKGVLVHDFPTGALLESIYLKDNIISMDVNQEYFVLGIVDGSIQIYEIKDFIPKKEIWKVIQTRRKPAMSLRFHKKNIISGLSNGLVKIFPINQNFKCKFSKCNEPFNSRDDLIYHVINQHVKVLQSQASNKEIQCGWIKCKFIFASNAGIQSIAEHVETHVL